MRNLQKLSYRNTLLFFSLIAAWPCVFSLMGYLPHYKWNILVLLFLCILYAMTSKAYFCIPQKLIRIVILQIVGNAIWFVLHSDASYITRIVFVSTAAMVVVIDLRKNNPLLIKIFVYWVTLQGVLSFVGLLLCLFGLIEPLSTFEEMDGRIGYNFVFFTTNTYLGTFVRPAGFFDEPGALACWGIYAMILNRLIVKKKSVEYILMGTLFITQSLAYFVQLALFLFYFYKKSLRKMLIPVMIPICVMGWIVNQSDLYYNSTVGRLEYDKSSGQFVGDSRVETREKAKYVFSQSPIIGVGASKMVNYYGNKIGDMSGNIYTFLAADGILGQLIMWIPYFYLFFVLGKQRRDVRWGTLILFVGLMQRPFDYNQLLFPLIIYATIGTLFFEKQNLLIEKYESKNIMA